MSCSKVPKMKFTEAEDQRLKNIVSKCKHIVWTSVAKKMKTRTARQCRERWINYIMPGISNNPWTREEDDLLDELYSKYGSKWQTIAKHFPNRSGNCVRNRYKLRLRHNDIPNDENNTINNEENETQEIISNPDQKCSSIFDNLEDIIDFVEGRTAFFC